MPVALKAIGDTHAMPTQQSPAGGSTQRALGEIEGVILLGVASKHLARGGRFFCDSTAFPNEVRYEPLSDLEHLRVELACLLLLYLDPKILKYMK